MMSTRLILVGGFLGAGKTTLLATASAHLKAQGYTVATVTNDQGANLVDTVLLRMQGIATAEVAGSCFCCDFASLINAISDLEAHVQPDVILAEAVGSCTDLMASVVRPLQKFHPHRFMVAPLTIALDSAREPEQFSPAISYLYRQQVAEAEFIVLTKQDVVDSQTIEKMRTQVQSDYPQATLFSTSARTGDGISTWIDSCMRQVSQMKHSLDLDYVRYAVAEGELAWLNAIGTVSDVVTASSKAWITEILEGIRTDMIRNGIGVAHMKLMINSADIHAKASLIDNSGPISWDILPSDTSAKEMEFVLNIRAHGSPEEVERIVRNGLNRRETVGKIRFAHFACFSPLPPRPTYRITDVSR